MDYFHLAQDAQALHKMSNLGLAYLGDAVYEVMVRSWLCLHGKLTPSRLHKAALAYVAAPRQAALMEKLRPILTEAETTVFKRGRNASKASVAKHASPEEYRASTGFECLLGWLYLTGQMPRVEELFEKLWADFNPNQK